MIWKKWRKPYIKVGGQRIKVRPLTLENALDLALRLAPYIARIERRWPELARAFQTTGGQRLELLVAVFTALRDELALAPGEMTRALALMLDCDAAWLAERITAREFLEALAVLDEVNDLVGIWGALRALGLTARYKDVESRTD